jgi:hypothetical protein
MDSCEFFLEQYNTVCSIVNDLFLKGVTDEQMRHQPDDGLKFNGLVPLAYGAAGKTSQTL